MSLKFFSKRGVIRSRDPLSFWSRELTTPTSAPDGQKVVVVSSHDVTKFVIFFSSLFLQQLMV